jgi:bifunctional DNase/RNase
MAKKLVTVYFYKTKNINLLIMGNNSEENNIPIECYTANNYKFHTTMGHNDKKRNSIHWKSNVDKSKI